MAKYTLIKYSKDRNSEWNRFIASAKNATFLFDRDFMDYHNDRFTDYSLMVYKDEELLAVLPANLNGGKLYSHQGLSYGGLVLDSTATFESALFALRQILALLSSEGISEIELKILPKTYERLPSDEILYLLFKLKAESFRRDITSVIDSSKKLTIDSSNRKRGIKKGVKNGLRVKETDDLATFWEEILVPNLKTVHNTDPVHTLEEIRLLKSKFPDNIKQFNVYFEDKVVAGTTIFETEKVAHAQYISANADKQQLGSLDFLFNYLINERYVEKPYFDFGISNENQGEQVNKGLLSWKESFGGRSFVHDFYRIKTANYVHLDQLFL